MGQLEGLVFGHEFAGEVIDSNNSKFNVRDRVTALPILPCLNCKMCNSGKEHLCTKAWDDTVGLSLGRRNFNRICYCSLSFSRIS